MVDGWRGYAMSLAVNLIATAIAYQIGGKYPALILFGLGIFLMLIVFISGKKNTKEDVANAAVPTITFAPVITQNNNPVTTNNQTANPSFIQTDAAIVDHEPEAKLTISSPRLALVGYDVFGVWSEKIQDHMGILINICNAAGMVGQRVGTATDLVVSAKIKDDSGRQVGSISRAYWLEKEGKLYRY